MVHRNEHLLDRVASGGAKVDGGRRLFGRENLLARGAAHLVLTCVIGIWRPQQIDVPEK